MKRLGLLAFLVGLPLLATPPDFSANYRFTNRLGEPTDGKAVYNGAARSIALDNTAMGCSGFQINYASEGLTGVSVNLQTNTKIWFGGLSFGVGPTWSTFGGTATTGSLPMTSTTAGLYVGYGSYPYVAINVATFTGTGSIDVTFSCWKSITYAQAIGGGGGGGGTFPSTTNLIAGTATPNVGADSGVAPANVPLLNAANAFSQAQSAPSFTGSGSNPFMNFPSNTTHTGAAGDLWNNAGTLQFGTTPLNVVVSSGNPSAGVAHFAGSTQTSTGGPVVNADMSITGATCSAPQVVTAVSATAGITCGTVPIPSGSHSAAYTTVLGDAGLQLLHPTADNNARTFTIDSNANVAYPVGTVLTFVNQINTVTIAITADTLQLAGSATTGSRTLAVGGMATAIKVTSTLWFISGPGLT